MVVGTWSFFEKEPSDLFLFDFLSITTISPVSFLTVSYSFLKTTQRNAWVDVHLYELFKKLGDSGINKIKWMNEDGNYILKIGSNKIKYDITSNEYYVETTTIRNKLISDFIVSLRNNNLIHN